MKCVCGYEYEDKWNPAGRNYDILKGDEEFIRVEGSFTISRNDWCHDWCHRTVAVSLYACPKCGTIRMEE